MILRPLVEPLVRDLITSPLDPRVGGGFDPLSIGFTAIYDAADTSAMWQDTSGTTPAAVNATVARVDDKSGNGFHATQPTAGSRPTLRGMPTGPNLVANPNLYDATGYTFGSGWSHSKPHASASAATSNLDYSLSAEIGQVYLLAYTITRSAGTITPSFGGVTGTARSLTGRCYDFITATSTASLSFAGSSFTGTAGDIHIYRADAANVGAPYYLDGVGKFLTGTISGLSAYPLTEFARVRNAATAGTSVAFGVQASGTNYKGINSRGSAIDRNASTLTASMPMSNLATKDEMQMGVFEGAQLIGYGDGINGTAAANTNVFTAPVTVGIGTTGGLTLTGGFFAGGVLGRLLTTDEIRNLTEYYRGTRAIICWGDSMTAGQGSTVAGWVVRLGNRRMVQTSNQGVGGETSEQIIARFQADTTDRKRWISTWWSGQNDNYVANGWTPTLNSITSFVSGVQGSGRYLVFGATMASGSAVITAAGLDELDATLESLYGERFVDVRAYLQSKNDGSANDLSDVAAGLVPRSLRVDNIHFNDTGYQHVADLVDARIIELGW